MKVSISCHALCKAVLQSKRLALQLCSRLAAAAATIGVVISSILQQSWTALHDCIERYSDALNLLIHVAAAATIGVVVSSILQTWTALHDCTERYSEALSY